MSDEYITQAQLLKRLGKPSFTEDEEEEATDIREAVSRLVEDYLGVAYGFFIPPEEAEERRIYGLGASVFMLPAPIFGETTITTQAGLTVPDFTVEGNNLITLDEQGNRTPFIVWGNGIYYDIESFWGYEVIPPQIREACLEIASRVYRERPESGFAGMVGDATRFEGVLARGFPSIARQILDAFKSKIATDVEGGSLYIA